MSQNPSIQMFVWLDKQILVYPHNEILPSNKKDTLFIHATTWMNVKNTLSERASIKTLLTVWLPLYDILEKKKL